MKQWRSAEGEPIQTSSQRGCYNISVCRSAAYLATVDEEAIATTTWRLPGDSEDKDVHTFDLEQFFCNEEQLETSGRREAVPDIYPGWLEAPGKRYPAFRFVCTRDEDCPSGQYCREYFKSFDKSGYNWTNGYACLNDPVPLEECGRTGLSAWKNENWDQVGDTYVYIELCFEPAEFSTSRNQAGYNLMKPFHDSDSHYFYYDWNSLSIRASGGRYYENSAGQEAPYTWFADRWSGEVCNRHYVDLRMEIP